MRDLVQTFLLIWLGAMLAAVTLFYMRDRDMHNQESFDVNQPDHIVSLAHLLNSILNERRTDVRFALLIWQDQHADVQGLISNDTSDTTVVGMLDDAKLKISVAKGVIHHTAGHA